ncbi:MAG: phosphate acyltransferase [Bdellovibrionales bacterium]|nr:phosphate acyltransferase [Bdellovibrionales bacterium]
MARDSISDFDQYLLQLEALQGAKQIFFQQITRRVKNLKKKPKILFPEGESPRILKAINATASSNLYTPVLLGDSKKIQKTISSLRLSHLKNVEIQNPEKDKNFNSYAEKLSQGKNISLEKAKELMKDSNYFGSMSAKLSHTDGMITGATKNYVDSIRPILNTIGCHPIKLASGMNIILVKDKIFIFADTTVNIDPTAEQVAQIAEQTLKLADLIRIQPRIAFLSFSNFAGQKENPKKMKKALEIFQKKYPDIISDGEIQADTACNPEIIQNLFPSSPLKEGANILVFPNLDSANIAYKLVQQLGSGEVVGPILIGVQKPVDIVQQTGTVEDVTNTILFNLLKIQAYNKNH